MATFPYDPMTLQALMESIPDTQRKKRRAEELRKTTQEFKEMGAKQATGSYSPTTHGGLFETVPRYTPDYAGMANQAVGGLGGYLTGQQAEQEQQAADQAQTEALLGASQQMGGGEGGSNPVYQGPEMPTQTTLRIAMGLLGGPDMKDYLPRDPYDRKVHSVQKDKATGKAVLIYNTGETEKTDIDYEHAWQYVNEPGQQAPAMVALGGNRPGMTRGLDEEPLGAAPPPTYETPPGEEMTTQEMADFQAIPPSEGPGGSIRLSIPELSPSENLRLSQKLATLPEDQQQPYLTDYLAMRGVDTSGQAAPQPAQQPAPEAGPAPLTLSPATTAPVAPATGATVSPAANVPRTGRIPGKPSQAQIDAEKARLEVQAAGQKDLDAAMLKERTTARENLGKLRNNLTGVRETIQVVRGDPKNLKRVAAGTMGSFVPKQEGYLGDFARSLYAWKNEKGADTLADLKQIAGGVYAQGFQSLVGQGAGSITETEGGAIRDALANISTAQSPERMDRAIEQFERLISQIEARLERVMRGEETLENPGPRQVGLPQTSNQQPIPADEWEVIEGP